MKWSDGDTSTPFLFLIDIYFFKLDIFISQSPSRYSNIYPSIHYRLHDTSLKVLIIYLIISIHNNLDFFSRKTQKIQSHHIFYMCLLKVFASCIQRRHGLFYNKLYYATLATFLIDTIHQSLKFESLYSFRSTISQDQKSSGLLDTK